MKNILFVRGEYLNLDGIRSVYLLDFNDLELLFLKGAVLDLLAAGGVGLPVLSVSGVIDDLSQLEFRRVHVSLPNSIKFYRVFNKRGRLVNLKCESKDVLGQFRRLPFFLRRRNFFNKRRFLMLYDLKKYGRLKYVGVRDPFFFYNYRYFYERKGSSHAFIKYKRYERELFLKISGYNSYKKSEFSEVYSKNYKFGGLNTFTELNRGLFHFIRLAINKYFKIISNRANLKDKVLFYRLERLIHGSFNTFYILKYKQDKLTIRSKYKFKWRRSRLAIFKYVVGRYKYNLKTKSSKSFNNFLLNNPDIFPDPIYIKKEGKSKLYYFNSFSELKDYNKINNKNIKWPYFLEDKRLIYSLARNAVDVRLTSRFFNTFNIMDPNTFSTMARIGHFRGFLFQKVERKFSFKYAARQKIQDKQDLANLKIERRIKLKIKNVRILRYKPYRLLRLRKRCNKFFLTKNKPRLRKSIFGMVHKYANCLFTYHYKRVIAHRVKKRILRQNKRIGLTKYTNRTKFFFKKGAIKPLSKRGEPFYEQGSFRGRDFLFNIMKNYINCNTYNNVVLSKDLNSLYTRRVKTELYKYNNTEFIKDTLNLLFPELDFTKDELRTFLVNSNLDSSNLEKKIHRIKYKTHNKSLEHLRWFKLTKPDSCFTSELIKLLAEGKLNIMLFNNIYQEIENENIILLIDYLKKCLKTRQVLMDYTPSIVEIKKAIEIYKLCLLLKEIDEEIVSTCFKY
ncbi:hypothetical protein H696_09010 (mitochondrion) [Fonticula alba]|uniref:Uncharacterized protein n=1 Tax=Fonticula alba TaxID=691883 RepID=A0A058Z0W3_FONAL|nr:hypothetical protein H696_09010 [Fonticula alba]KCV67182.1 hypothetical protein H696_09010 [Fonticula alba]|eukprot:XP_009498416.1 hypothetical protein H696_09010 (mitochondrion) [Fonticula alba]